MSERQQIIDLAFVDDGRTRLHLFDGRLGHMKPLRCASSWAFLLC